MSKKKRKGELRGKFVRQQELIRLTYPHYAGWTTKRYLVKEGCILEKEGQEAVITQVLKPTIPGDVPGLIVKYGEKTETAS